ncbi:MAG: hypothetical protein HFG07_02365 [Oscillibacter sp.]|nr:hypothetical protein [Oscillibacter sp.]
MSWNVYEEHFIDRLNKIYPGVYNRLFDIKALPEAAAEAVLREVLETGCLSQNCGNITAARRAVLRLPPDWVAAHLPSVAPACLFREAEWREWEFRRAAELLADMFPEAYEWLLEHAAGLEDPEVAEAIEDLRK